MKNKEEHNQKYKYRRMENEKQRFYFFFTFLKRTLYQNYTIFAQQTFKLFAFSPYELSMLSMLNTSVKEF